MNKYKKAESRRVKALLKCANACGCQFTYRQVRRHVRKWDRDIKALPTVVMRSIRKGIKRIDYGVANAVKQISNGLRAGVPLCDELEHYRPILEEGDF